MASPETVKKPSLLYALIPLVLMASLLGVGYGVYKIKAQVLLTAAAALTGILGHGLGFSWKEMERGIVESITKAMPAILIMLAVGVMIGSWMASGTIPMVVYYGLKLISPQFFLVTACFICSLTAVATGTSWGTIGTVGVAFIGIAMGLGIPLGLAAGAVVCGAYFGDKMSPFSDIPNLAAVTAGADLFDHIKHTMKSAVPGWILSLAVYFVLGFRYAGGTVSSESVTRLTETLRTHFTFNIWLLLPVLVVFYLAFAKKPTVPGMLLSSFVAAVLAALFQKAGIVEIATAMNTGYPSATGVAEVDRLLSRGGLMSMMETQLVAITAFCFGGIMQKTGMLAVILEKVMAGARKAGSIVLVTIGSAVVTALVTGSSYLSVILPGELLGPAFKRLNLAPKNLSRIIAECGGIIVPLVPWSMAGVYVAGTLGVPVLDYLPWAIGNYAALAILAAYGLSGFTMTKSKD
ncbi:MAG: Na+/H+ antiporter NhaC [Candidatus Aminicenantes bacterium]|nr:Na+/H+ antiporter NhaC [Candidatus Aminicenantes bacterium]